MTAKRTKALCLQRILTYRAMADHMSVGGAYRQREGSSMTWGPLLMSHFAFLAGRGSLCWFRAVLGWRCCGGLRVFGGPLASAWGLFATASGSVWGASTCSTVPGTLAQGASVRGGRELFWELAASRSRASFKSSISVTNNLSLRTGAKPRAQIGSSCLRSVSLSFIKPVVVSTWVAGSVAYGKSPKFHMGV
jgi:hypothetical protein